MLLFSIVKSQNLTNYRDIIDLEEEFETVNPNLEELNSVDLSSFWINNSSERRLGFIGEKYQRLKIKFISIKKDDSNPNEYSVYGKSNVSNNICEFNGKLKIKESYYIKSLEFPTGNTGILAGEYLFSENVNQTHSGIFKGRFVTYWYKDKDGQIKYNDLLDAAAMYNNNQFAGTWTQYGKQDKKQANWGDSRIPLSGDLDVGTSEFCPSDKYASNGWITFLIANGGSPDQMNKKAAQRAENDEWWEEKLELIIENLIGAYGGDEETENAYFGIFEDSIYYPDPNLWIKYELKKDTIITTEDDYVEKWLVLKLTTDSLVYFNFSYDMKVPLNRRKK